MGTSDYKEVGIGGAKRNGRSVEGKNDGNLRWSQRFKDNILEQSGWMDLSGSRPFAVVLPPQRGS